MFRLMNLIQVESLAKVLNQVVSDDWTSVVLQRLIIPDKLKRIVLGENLLRVLQLAVAQPLILTSSPIAIMPLFFRK